MFALARDCRQADTATQAATLKRPRV